MTVAESVVQFAARLGIRLSPVQAYGLTHRFGGVANAKLALRRMAEISAARKETA